MPYYIDTDISTYKSILNAKKLNEDTIYNSIVDELLKSKAVFCEHTDNYLNFSALRYITIIRTSTSKEVLVCPRNDGKQLFYFTDVVTDSHPKSLEDFSVIHAHKVLSDNYDTHSEKFNVLSQTAFYPLGLMLSSTGVYMCSLIVIRPTIANILLTNTQLEWKNIDSLDARNVSPMEKGLFSVLNIHLEEK